MSKYDDMHAMASELYALRAQVTELQRQLDEAAKQISPDSLLPWAWVIPKAEPSVAGWIDCRIDRWGEFTMPLYRRPPNATALIEQARAEERERAMQIVEAQRQKILNNPNDPSWTEYLAELNEAIRARKV